MLINIRLYWLPCAFLLILGLGTAGFLIEGAVSPERDISFLDALYHSLQLFALEYPDDYPANDLLQFARFAAAAFSTLTVLGLLVPWLVRWALLNLQALRPMRAIVLGYGPAGQALARELRSRRNDRFAVTAVRRGVAPEHVSTARRDGVLLVEGDPSDPQLHRRIRLRRARKVFAALENDMHTLDAAEAARRAIGDGEAEVVALVIDPDIAAGLAESSPRGFLGGAGIRGYSLPQEAAQSLIADARFDRVALEAAQKRVHLVVLGCGAQGEAVVIETLLTAWRAGLEPPKITIFDRDIETVEARFRRRSPALFIGPQEPGHLPHTARPELVLRALDIEKTDFGSDKVIEELCGDAAAVTAWVFAASEDSLNLRGALGLHTAMLRRQRAAAPIHVRIWNRHAGDTPMLSRPHVSIAQAFGSYENAIATTLACDLDPDRAAKALHARYLATGARMRAEDPSFTFSDVPWEELGETFKAANRRLHRHAVMKLEDLDAQWRRQGLALPVVAAELRDRGLRLEERFDYAVIDAGPLPAKWWRGDEPLVLREGDLECVSRIRNVAMVEHNRWTIDRALDGWRPTSELHPVRDNERRVHPNMSGWDKLPPLTRRWDAVMLRTLIEGGSEGSITAWKRKTGSLVLAFDKAAASQPRWIGREALLGERGVTEIDLAIVAMAEPKPVEEAARKASQAMQELLAGPGLSERLCRLRLTFATPPGEKVLQVANAIAAVAEESRLEVSSSWLWSKRERAVGFVGHRDLDRLGGAEGLAAHLQRLFVSLIAGGRAIRLVSGYAPGADRIAVDCWNALGLTPPEIVFPYKDIATGEFLTDAAAKAGTEERVSAEAAARVGVPRLAPPRDGDSAHAAQALDIIEQCSVLVAVFDGNGSSGVGSVGDTIERARARGLAVIEVVRDDKGNFHDRES
jgi:voltage-gated potassium channel Kch